MPTVDFVRGLPPPAAVIAAEHDSIVPARRSRPLRAAIPNLVLRGRSMPANIELYRHPAFAEAMREALARIEAAAQ